MFCFERPETQPMTQNEMIVLELLSHCPVSKETIQKHTGVVKPANIISGLRKRGNEIDHFYVEAGGVRTSFYELVFATERLVSFPEVDEQPARGFFDRLFSRLFG